MSSQSYLYHDKGIYHCNDKFFYNKIDAIFEANASNKHIAWKYHDDIFKKYKWDVDPAQSLDEIYKQRALQLRDAYDHLVLFFSGGIDSGYILKTFIDNDIKIDEIYIYGAFKAEEKQSKLLKNNTDPGYYTREINQFYPLIKKLAEEKKVKVNVFDWTNEILTGVNDLDWFYNAGTRFDPTCFVRSKLHKVYKEHTGLLDKGKRVGFVFGIDKPRLMRDDHNIYFSFLDVIMSSGPVPTNDILGETWENDEYFYWTPNMPELVIKQSHVVVNWLKSQNKLHLIKHINHLAAWHDPAYYAEVDVCCYPTWDHTNFFKVKKPTGAIYNELSKWFFDDHLEARLRWESSLWELERLCGKKWFNDNTVTKGLNGHLSPLYKIATY